MKLRMKGVKMRVNSNQYTCHLIWLKLSFGVICLDWSVDNNVRNLNHQNIYKSDEILHKLV